MATRPSRSRVLLPRVAALALLAGAALSGCGGSEDADPSAAATASGPASSAPSGDPTDEPDDTGAPAGADDTADGSADGGDAEGSGASDGTSGSDGASEDSVSAARAEAEAPELPEGLRNRPKDRAAFSAYVVDAWSYAFLTNDPAPLLDVAVDGGCDGCGALRREMRDRAEEGYFVELTGVGVGETREPRKQPPSGRVTITRTSLALPESRILEEDGTLRAISPAHPDTVFTVKVRWLPPQANQGDGAARTPGELQLVSFGVETNDG